MTLSSSTKVWSSSSTFASRATHYSRGRPYFSLSLFCSLAAAAAVVVVVVGGGGVVVVSRHSQQHTMSVYHWGYGCADCLPRPQELSRTLCSTKVDRTRSSTCRFFVFFSVSLFFAVESSRTGQFYLNVNSMCTQVMLSLTGFTDLHSLSAV